jgi:predicted nucleic acid-binding Zn ribbon protein
VTGSNCCICGTAVGWVHPEAVCSPDCYRQLRLRRRRVTHAERTCAACGEAFTPSRVDARYCGDRCRQRAHRSVGEGGEANISRASPYNPGLLHVPETQKTVFGTMGEGGASNMADHPCIPRKPPSGVTQKKVRAP